VFDPSLRDLEVFLLSLDTFGLSPSVLLKML